MASQKIADYLALLVIRRTAKRRDAMVTGTVFLVSFLAMFALGMLGRLTGRSLYLAVGMVTAFGFAYLTAMVKLETLKGNIELVDNFLRMNEE